MSTIPETVTTMRVSFLRSANAGQLYAGEVDRAYERAVGRFLETDITTAVDKIKASPRPSEGTGLPKEEEKGAGQAKGARIAH